MCHALALAARRLAGVLAGQSLAQHSVAQEPEHLRGQVHEILYGTLRRYGEGDAILTHFVDRELDPNVRALLLVALYRLVTSPDESHTVVNQAVDAAPLADCGKAGGLINAVLRNYLRQKDRVMLAVRANPAVAAAHPMWWLERMQGAYPDAWPAIVAANNALPPISIRINCRRTTKDELLAKLQAAGVRAETLTSPFPDALRLHQPGRIDRLPGHAEGLFSVQDPGAQRAAMILDPQEGESVLDACAAPGGKAAHLLERANIRLTALDDDPARCELIHDTLNRLGLSARVLCGDAGRPDQWQDEKEPTQYDRILVDVPCTASGVVRRHPDAKWLRRPTDISSFGRQQARILQALWPLLKSGGRLLYATCSVFPEENNSRISAFIAATPDARCESEEQWLPSPDCDGFYYALLVKA